MATVPGTFLDFGQRPGPVSPDHHVRLRGRLGHGAHRGAAERAHRDACHLQRPALRIAARHRCSGASIGDPDGHDTRRIAAISTDTTPDSDLYRLSIDQAVGSGRPTYIVFATPAFCQTATCGPTLDIVKSVAPEYKDRVDFIHVEPYLLQTTDAGLQPLLDANGGLQVVQAVNDYGLPTEPYQFLVDGSGIVRDAFQGIASVDEIRAAIDAVLAGS